jgi:hypothetical protein
MIPTRAQGARASFTVGLIVALIVGLAAAAPSEGKDCQSDTMLPSDVRVTIPGADVPASAARFSGTWNGLWKDKDRDDGLCRTLVVEDVLANGFARVVYSHGTYEGWKVRQPNFWRASGRVVDGVLRLEVPYISRPDVTYRFVDGTLRETFRGQPSATLTRMRDVSLVGCRAQPAPAPPAPSRSGPRDRLTADELLAPPSSARVPRTIAISRPWAHRDPPGTHSRGPSKSRPLSFSAPTKDVQVCRRRCRASPWPSSRTASTWCRWSATSCGRPER